MAFFVGTLQNAVTCVSRTHHQYTRSLRDLYRNFKIAAHNFEIEFPFQNWVKIPKFVICAVRFQISVNLQIAWNVHVCTHAKAIPGLLTPYPARPADLLTGSPAGDGLTEDGSSNGKLRVIMCSLTCLLSHSITKGTEK